MQDVFRPVRRGGRKTTSGFRFELTGGILCLDLANTVDNRPTARRRELLNDVGDLVSWACQTGILTVAEAARTRRRADRHPQGAGAALRRARGLREILYRLFSAVAAGGRRSGRVLDAFNAWLPAARAGSRIVPGGGGFEWEWDKPDSIEAVLYPVVRSAADLLTSPGIDRIRECAAPECGWLFLDRSRNRSRRWCDMAVCGNRNKARRHFRKTRRSRRRSGSRLRP